MEKHIYLDNAASTFLEPEVLDCMLPYFTEIQGNPSSTHFHGRNLKNAIEKARKTTAELLNARPSEIFFTSGGSEADNMIIYGCVQQYGIKHIISSKLEHHAVTHPIEDLEHKNIIQAHWVNCNHEGVLDYNHLEELLLKYPKSLVVLMHGNNELGNLLDIQKVAQLCNQHQCYFHSDTVQTLGHYPIDAKAWNIHFFTGAAHKFHGPKGVGILYVNENVKIPALILGGSQERNLRGGTENVSGIIGFAKALEIAVQNQEKNYQHLQHLKTYFKTRLKELIPTVQFNGSTENSMVSVLNVRFPQSEYSGMLLFQMDINKISVSAGSACTSGSNVGSHVLNAIGLNSNEIENSVRFSFGRQNTIAELDYVLEVLNKMFTPKTA